MFAPTVETTIEHSAMPAPADPWMSPEQIVADLPDGVATVRKVRGWIARGVLEGSHPATGVWLVRRSAYEAWVAGGMRRTRPDAAPRARRLPVPEPIQPGRLRGGMSRRASRTTDLRLT